jgi:hypothetical protein
MAIIVFLFLLFGKVGLPKGLFVSSLISYVLISISILDLSFKLQIPNVIGCLCFTAAFYPSHFLILISGTWVVFFLEAFIVDTLLIFVLIKLLLYIKDKLTSKKRTAA